MTPFRSRPGSPPWPGKYTTTGCPSWYRICGVIRSSPCASTYNDQRNSAHLGPPDRRCAFCSKVVAPCSPTSYIWPWEPKLGHELVFPKDNLVGPKKFLHENHRVFWGGWPSKFIKTLMFHGLEGGSWYTYIPRNMWAIFCMFFILLL